MRTEELKKIANLNLIAFTMASYILAGSSLQAPVIAAEHEQKHPHSAKPAHHDGVLEEIIIKAPPKVVWQSILEQRKLDPDSKYCKPITDNNKQALVEQKFVFPSFLGDTECVLHLAETPGERIDFKLFESEDLRKMEGYWNLTPIDNGQATKLTLSSFVVPVDPVPQMVTNTIIRHKTKKNLAMVKKLAEKSM